MDLAKAQRLLVEGPFRPSFETYHRTKPNQDTEWWIEEPDCPGFDVWLRKREEEEELVTLYCPPVNLFSSLLLLVACLSLIVSFFCSVVQ